ncbi:MAG: efflux RND transporter permease subunit [Candidatus Aminicenantes bacterium]|nr:efflux RND transporter permease subunit [Candidatus Aminicenantes bacterium]
MFLADISIKRPVMISMALIVFLVFGTMAFFNLSLDLMPEVELGFVTVQTIYPGAGPKEIETQITKKIEDAVATISLIDFVQSYSMDSVSIIILKFELGKDADIANQEVKDKVDAILAELPDDAEPPIVQKFDINVQPIVNIVLTGSVDMIELFEIADKKLKDRFSQVEGVAKVDLVGGRQREIRVELDNRVVFENAISLAQLSGILKAANMDMPGGQFQQQSQEFSVRLKGELDSVTALEELEIPTPFGSKKLGRIARIRDTGAEIRERTTYFNNLKNLKEDKVVLLSITKSADANTVDMATALKEAMPQIEKELPAGCKLSVVMDKSLFIKSSVEDTLGNIGLGILLTALVLLFFLHDIRATIIAALAMPFSIISTFLLMQVSGFTLNIMTLMGLSTAVGILVTNSVVVLENIFRHKEMGHSRREAAGKGTAEIAVAVLASTMTNIVVFLPIASMSSMVGQFFKQFALTVTFATIFSIIVSFTLTPMMASLIIPDKKTKKNRIGKKLDAMFHSWERGYRKILAFIIKNRLRSALVIAAAVALFIFSFTSAARIGFEFMPALDEGDISVEVELPQGYNLQASAELIEQVENRLRRHKDVKHILTQLGSISETDIGPNLAKVMVKLVDAEKRELTSIETAGMFIRELSDIPNARIRVAASTPMGNGEAPVTFYLLGQDTDRLEVYKNEIIAKIKDTPGLTNLNSSSRPGKPEITLTPYRKKIADAGLTIFDLAMTLRSAVEGIIATRYREAGEEYDIRVVLSEDSVDTPEKIGNIAVVSRSGVYRLAQLAKVDFTSGYSNILHKDKYKAISFSGYLAPGYVLGDVVTHIRERLTAMELPGGYKIDWGSSVQMMEETAVDMLQTFIIAFLLTYMLLAAILESLTQPLMILGTVPLAMIGVFWALDITGKTLNTISMMAIIMLLGIVVNNAILLLDYTNLLRKKGKDIKEALLEACPTRLKPILMATIAIMLGMLPMALGIGSSGKEFRQPMGIVSIGGLIISAVLTLIVIPSIYNLVSRRKSKVSK